MLASKKMKLEHFVRFILVGIVNTAFSYSIYAGLVYLGVGYALANLVSLIAGVVFSFKTQGTLVFGSRDNRLLGRFIVGWALIYLCTIVIIGRFIALGLDPYSAGALMLPLAVTLSYLMQRHWVFRARVGLLPTDDR